MASGNLVRFGSQFDDKVSGPLDRIKGKFDTLGKSKGFQSVTQGIGMGMGISAWGALSQGMGMATDFLKGSIDAANDMNETVSKSQAVFRGAAGEVEAFGDSASEALKMSKTEAIAAAADFGNMFTALGMSNTEAANLSMNIVQLGADLASFNNLDPAEALQKLRSGLAGEAEPLKSLGVFINDAALKAKALEMGIGGAGRALTEAEKVTIRYALIMEQTATAQGDVARTGDQLAGQQREVTARIADLQAEIGTKLLPIVLDLTKGFADWLESMEGLVNFLDGDFNPAVEESDRKFLLWVANISDAVTGFLIPGFNAATTTLEEGWKKMDADTEAYVESISANIVAGGRDATEKYRDSWRQLPGIVEESTDEATEVAFIAGKEAVAAYNQSVTDGWDSSVQAWEDLLTAQEEPMANAKRIAQLEGYLASAELAAGLRSGDPLVRDAAYNSRDTWLAELALLRNPSYNHGLGTGKAWGDGFRASSQYVMAQIGRVVTQANAYLRAQSPPSDPRNPLHRIDEWGERTGHAWAEGFAGGIKMDGVGQSLKGVASGLTGLAPAMAGMGGGGPTVVVNIGDFHGTSDNIEELNRRLGETVRAATLRRN